MPHPISAQDASVISENTLIIEAIRLGTGLDFNTNNHPNTQAYFKYQAVSLALADDIMDAKIQENKTAIDSINSIDEQTLILEDNQISISNNGTSISLDPYLDNTDDQTGVEVNLDMPLDVDADGINELTVGKQLLSLQQNF